jgi:antirestriction protein ArdC
VPELAQYDRPEEYYSTLFHEMGHSTGHPDRLNRKQTGGFGSHDYGREELIAEMTNAYLCAEAGIQVTFDNSAAYLASWIRTIREDVRAVVVAAGAAQRAADHILNRTFEDKPEADTEADTAPAKEVANA